MWRVELSRSSPARPRAPSKQEGAAMDAASLAKMAADRRKLAGHFKC
jgi:hypothetical protein